VRIAEKDICQAGGEAQGPTVLMRYRMRRILLRNDTTYFVVLTSVQ